ncbi:hypothetical protein SERLADRAFT_447357 [Serpula lacrymans var. lacrymans S7.9]|uniref:DUF1479 domain protein n=1 Tax=Serpula lacrymans var. lacrymans (strain S7.9) TaxID=578457 RepID=F8NQF2_SERL9|nr:uncharacterized protein SERLADRAFT_447357 [Serpula lacrymans var. lacrymans S7.9]EGO26082.1 hypothetical protein SERLADRAFT_447357 [Serpula lacrymans var. lacrymans S7.9]
MFLSYFSNLAWTGHRRPSHLPERYAELKRHVLADVDHAALLESWREVLEEVGNSAEEIISRGGDVIPRVSYADIEKGLSEAQIHAIKNTGVVVVTGGVPKDEALGWKQSIKDYIASNPVKGFPPENIQAYELYNTKSQTYARTHPAVLRTQKALLGLWHSSSPVPIDFSTPISYFDRLRIRTPGDTSFTLGPHMDGGSIERWEDKTYRNVYRKILSGGSLWKEYDPFDARWRLRARQDLYNTPNQCSILRCWQGWTSLSTTGVNEGTLRVLPMLSAATAYLILRPFFRPRVSLSSLRTPYKVPFEDWEIDLESSAFPGTTVRGAQELNANTHPHLRLDKTMVSVPLIEPGDQVYWHCDLIHSVESVHQGTSDSSVLYIPAVPLTLKNALYLRDQRINFVHGYPAPDFPGGEGESKFLGRASAQDIHTREGRQALGFEPFVSSAGSSSVKLHEEANKILFG